MHVSSKLVATDFRTVPLVATAAVTADQLTLPTVQGDYNLAAHIAAFYTTHPKYPLAVAVQTRAYLPFDSNHTALDPATAASHLLTFVDAPTAAIFDRVLHEPIESLAVRGKSTFPSSDATSPAPQRLSSAAPRPSSPSV